MKSVRIVIQSTLSRVAFQSGTYSASLEDEGDYAILGTTRGHDSWKAAAIAALRLANRRNYIVANRGLVERRIALEGA